MLGKAADCDLLPCLELALVGAQNCLIFLEARILQKQGTAANAGALRYTGGDKNADNIAVVNDDARAP